MTNIQSPASAYSRSNYKASAVLLAALAASGLASTASAQKLDNTTNLNAAGSWTGGTIPNSGTVAVFNSTLTTARIAALGASATWGGIQVTNPGGVFTISSGNFLTLGASGIDMSSANNNFVINSGIITGAAQNWSINALRSLQLGTNSSVVETGGAISTSGAGTLDFRSGTAATISGVVGNTSVSVNGPTTALTLANSANTFTNLAVASGKAVGSVITASGVASSFGTDNDIALGGNGQSGVIEYTGNTASTNRNFTRDGRGSASGITVTTAGQTLTITGNTSSGNQINALTNGWVFGGAGNITLNGQTNNSSGVGSTGTTVTKNGTGTLTFVGNNGYTGTTTVNGGTLALGASERINVASNLVMNSGTFALGGFTETLGTLDVNGNSTIDLGSGGVAIFANSSAVAWDGASTLSIAGTFVSGSSIKFGIDATGLSGSQLAQIFIAGYDSLALNGSGFLTASAIPEPSAFAALAGLGALGLVASRRRRAV
ncbi:MAG: autotransporter-associated beta strand repeat-containing protein [Burkholderiales bacterium]|nr:autotransporter-associated beta strand repeat-containing protein [Opitutaceae bacterium]